MERFVRLVAPTNKVDFVTKLIGLVVICGVFNHLRDLITDGYTGADPFTHNLFDASFTAVPMCAFALLLISHLNRLQIRLYLQAMRDPLTGLPNRRWFMENTPDALKCGQALMIVDIDHFKSINDSFGHDVGDEALRAVAEHLNTHLEDKARCARIGGEEFAVFFPSAVQSELEEIANIYSAGFMFDVPNEPSKRITSSVGLVLCQAECSRAEAIRRADAAVYEAKALGRARFAVASVDNCRTHPATSQTQSA